MSYTDEGFDFSFGELLPQSPEEQIAADEAQAEAQDVALKKTEDAMFEAAGEQNPYDEAVEGTARQETGSDARQGSQAAAEQGQAATDAGEPANVPKSVPEPTPAVPSQTEEPEAQTSVSAEEAVQQVAVQEPVAEPQQEAAIQPAAEQQDSQMGEQAQEPAPEVAETAKPVPASADEANVETPELRERRARYTRLGYPEFLDAIYLDPKQKEDALNALELPWETDANGNVKTIGEAIHDDPNGFLAIIERRNSTTPPSEDSLDKKTVLKAKADAREYALQALAEGEEVEVDWRNFIPTEEGRSIPPTASLFAEFLSSPDPYSWLYRKHSDAFKAYVDIQTAKAKEAISAMNALLDKAIDEMKETVDGISEELNSPVEMQSAEQANAEPAEQVEEVHQEEATDIEEEVEEAEDEDERGIILAKMVTEFERPSVDSVIKTLGFSLPEGWTASRKEDLSATEDGYVITLTDSLSDKNGESRVSLQTRISIEEAFAKESLRPDGYDVTVRSSIEGDGCSVVHSLEKTPYANILDVVLQIPKIKKNKRNPGKSDIYELRRTTSSNNRVSTSVTANFDKMTMDDFQTKWELVLKRIGVLGNASEQKNKSATKSSAQPNAAAPETAVADEASAIHHPVDGLLTAPNGTKNFGEIHVEGIPNGFVRMRDTDNLPEGIGFERKTASDAVIKKIRQFGFDSEGDFVSFIADNIRAGFVNKKDGSFILASTIVAADGKSRYIAITKAVFSNGIYTVVEEDIIDEKDFSKAYIPSYEPRFFSPAAGKVIENSPPPSVQAQETSEQKEEGAKKQTPSPVVDSSGIRVPAKRREIVTPDNAMRVTVTPKFVKASAVVSSDMENYPAEMQPRDRGTMASRMQIDDNARTLNPALVLQDAVSSDTGAPKINSDGVVLSGNGRTMFIRQAHQIGNGAAYDAAVRDKAEALGVELPPLPSSDFWIYAEEIEGLGHDEQVRFTELSNRSGILQRSQYEMAEADGKLILGDAELLQRLSEIKDAGDIDFHSRAYDGVIGRFVYLTGDKGLLDSAGRPVETAYDRLGNGLLGALLLRMPQERSRDAIRAVIERDSTGQAAGMQRVLRGIQASAPYLIQLDQTLEGKNGRSITLAIGEALTEYIALKKEMSGGKAKYTNSDISNLPIQPDFGMFGAKPAETDFLVRELARRAASNKSIPAFLERYVRNARSAPYEADIFGTQPQTNLEILKASAQTTDWVKNGMSSEEANTLLFRKKTFSEIDAFSSFVLTLLRQKFRSKFTIEADAVFDNRLGNYSELSIDTAKGKVVYAKMAQDGSSIILRKSFHTIGKTIGDYVELWYRLAEEEASDKFKTIKDDFFKNRGGLSFLFSRNHPEIPKDKIKDRILEAILKGEYREELSKFISSEFDKQDIIRMKNEVFNVVQKRLFNIRKPKDDFADTKIADLRLMKTLKEIAEEEWRITRMTKKAKNKKPLAPDNKTPSLLPLEQWVHVRLNSFKNWFGDWENNKSDSSKILDENGEPLQVFHGTREGTRNYSVFSHTGVAINIFNEPITKTAFVFTPDFTAANHYSGSTGNVSGYFLNIRNPYYALTKDEVLEAFKAHSSRFSKRKLPYTELYYPGKTLDEVAELFIDPDGTIYNDRAHFSLYFVGHEIWPLIQEAIALQAKAKGCDGYVMRDWTNDIKHLTYGVFNRTAIKSSEYNIGKYGRTSVDTRFRTSEGDDIVRDAGRQPQPRQEGAVTDEQVNALNQELFGIERKGDASGIKAEEFEAKLMEEVAHEMASSLNLSNIDIVTDVSSLTGEKAEAKGWFDRTTGRITVVVPNHFDAEDIAKTVLHEAVAHYGLRRLFGEDFDSFLRDAILNSEPYIRARIERKAAVDRLNVMDAAEEVLAEIAQEMMNDSSRVSGTVKRFFARVRELLRAFLERITGGRFSIRYTENDLNAIIWNSYHNLIRDGVSTEATPSNADGNGSRFLYRTGDDPEAVEAAQKETDRVTDEAERNGTQQPRARFSLRSYAVAMMAHDKATGKKRDSEYWARVMAGLGLPVSEESFSELNKDAEAVLSGIREKGENILSRSMNDIAREAEKAAFPRVVETLFGQFGRQFGKVGDRAQEGYNKVRISMEESAPELTVEDMKATAGLDLVELLLSIPLERKGRRVKAKPEESRTETPEAEAVDADGVPAQSALEDGETAEEEAMPTDNDAEEKLNAALEAQINKVKAFREEIIAELEKWRLKEQERRRLRAERAMARAAAEENKKPDEEDDDASDGEIGYDEAVIEEELSGSVPDFASLLEALDNIGGLNLNNGAELSAVLRIWMEKLLGMDDGSSSDFGEGFAAYRKTLINMLREAADKLIPISSKTESNTVRNLERQIAMLERSRTAGELERKTAMVLTKLLKAGDRASRKEQIASLRAELRRTADAGKAYDEMEKAMHRKVLGMHQRAASYISKILTWGEVRIEQEMERLSKIIEGRFEDYATSVGEAEEDAVVIWAQERLSALSSWGGLYRKAPTEIAAESQKILKWLNEERYAHEKKWSEWRERVTGIRTALIAALKQAGKGRKQPSESTLGSFADTLTATVRQRLDEMLVGSGASGQELIDEILYTLNSGSEQLAAIKTRWRREARTIMEDAVEGTGKSVSDLNRELAEKIPEALNDLLTTEDQPIQMNWNQCLQLYASLCQTASYADNIAKYGREGQRAAIEQALYDKPELLRLVSLMREAYAKRRNELSEAFRSVTGNPIYSPDPFYMPVRMYLGGADATREGETHHAWMPFSKAFQPRVRNGRDFDLSQSLLGVWGKNTEDSACGIAFGLRGMELRSILFSPKTIEAMRQTIGRERTSKLLEQVTDTLMGGYKEPPNPVKDAIKVSGSALTYSALSWNAVTMLKQMAGFTAWAEVLDGGYIELAKHIMSYDRAAARELLESDGFIARFGSEGFGKMLKDALTDTSHNWIMRMYHAGMTTVQLGDYVASIIVGSGVYKAKKLQLMRNGMSEEEAGRKASTVTWALIEECQQSNRVENTPRFLRRGGVMAASVLKFASSPLLQTSHEYHAGRMWLKASRSGDSQAVVKWRARFVNTVICNHILMPVFMYGMAELFGIAILGREPPEEEEVLGDIIMQCVAGPLNRIILAGMAVDWTGEAIARALGGEPNVYRDSGNGMAANAMFQRVGNIGKKLVADFANEEYELVRNDVLDLLSVASRPASYIVEGSRNWSGYDKETVRRRATYERKKRDRKQQEHDSLRSRNAL